MEIELNWLDKVVAFVSPRAGVRRVVERSRFEEVVKFGYGDRPWERGLSGGQGRNASSESPLRRRDRINAMWDARDLVTYDWVGGVIAKVVLYIVGKLECKSNTGDPELDAEYDAFFHGWCSEEEDEEGRTQCDLSGRHTLRKLMQLAFCQMFTDGDFGFVIRGGDEDGLWLQSVEADRIGSPVEADQLLGTDETEYVGGLTIDRATGRIVSVRVYERNQTQQYVNPEEVEPRNFLHFADTKFSDQYRPMTWLLPALEDLRDLKETLAGEKVAIKDQTQYAGAVTTKDPTANKGPKAWSGKTEAGTPSQKAVWGQWLKLAEGESVNFLSPNARPSGAFLAFQQVLIRKMGIGLGLSYGFLWDLASLGGVTARIGVRSDERRIEGWQELAVKVLRRIRRLALNWGVAHRGLRAHPKMYGCDWYFGTRLVTDAGYEAQNDMMMMRAGVLSWDDVATKYSTSGGNLRDVMARNVGSVVAAQELAGAHRVPIETFMPDLMPSATSQLASANTPPEEVQPVPGSLEAVGEKGASQIVDLLISVAEGRLERESAVQTLVTVYGLLPGQAEMLVPRTVASGQGSGASEDGDGKSEE